MEVLKFNDENVYKGTSILYSVDSFHKSKGLSELGKKRRKIYMSVHKHITIVGTNLEKKINPDKLCILLRQRRHRRLFQTCWWASKLALT